MKHFRQTHIRKNLTLRSRILHFIRCFFLENDYIEVETPVRIPAPAPEVHIDAQPSGNWYLQTSPELCMKQLLAAGYPRIFQVCRVFRQKERGRKHLPEFSLLEWYAAGMDYNGMMAVCEDLISMVAEKIGFGRAIHYKTDCIDLAGPWDRLTVEAAFASYASICLEAALAEDRFDEILAEEIEPFLGRNKPVFLYDYPASKAALSRLKRDNPAFGERFELYISGIEICNAFSELNDAAEQRDRFEAEDRVRRKMGKTAYPLPEVFLEMLPHMPPCAGNAMGLDRLVMIFADAGEIDEVTAFVPEEL